MKFGYARTSTKAQKLERQIKALIDYGVSERFIYLDQYTGTTLKRTGLDSLVDDIDQIQGEHTLVVKELDRLGRNKEETSKFLKDQILSKGHTLVVLDMPYVEEFLKSKLPRDRSFPEKVLEIVGDMIIDFALLVAEEERNKIIKRTSEGRERAIANGVKLGRKEIQVIDFVKYYNLWKNKQLNVSKVCKEVEYKIGKEIKVGISRSKFYELLREYEKCS